MKGYIISIIVLLCIIFMYASGIITSKYATCEPTPHECISVCVEEFEKYGC